MNIVSKKLNTRVRWDGTNDETWTLNGEVTNSSCMVQIYGYNSQGLWLPANLFRCWGGEPEHMGSQLINHLYPFLLRTSTDQLGVTEVSYILQDVFHLTGTPAAINICKYLYVIIPSYRSIKGYKVSPYYVTHNTWNFEVQEEIDLKQYKKMKPVEFFK